MKLKKTKLRSRRGTCWEGRCSQKWRVIRQSMDKGVDMIKLTIYVYYIVTRKNKIIFKITYEA